MLERCSECKYSTTIYYSDSERMMHACGYLMKMYARRPCPAGEACRVFEERQAEERSAWL